MSAIVCLIKNKFYPIIPEHELKLFWKLTLEECKIDQKLVSHDGVYHMLSSRYYNKKYSTMHGYEEVAYCDQINEFVREGKNEKL